MRSTAGSRVREKGTAFFVVTLLAISSTALVGAYLAASLSRAKHVDSQASDTSAFNAAEAGMNAAIEKVWTVYKNASEINRFTDIDHLDGKYSPSEQVQVERTVGNSRFSATVTSVRVVSNDYADVQIQASGTNAQAKRSITAVIRYGRKPSEVFNHAYFINNFGWLWGSGITVNGSVRSNGDFSLQNATVNGDIYASENSDLGTAGTISGTSSSLSVPDYNAAGYDGQARPTNPSAPSEDLNGNGKLDPGEDANGNGILDTYSYDGGYDGSPKRYQNQPVVNMPYLGDLSTYKQLATQKNGTISQGGTVLVDHTLGDASGQSKNIILIGTKDNPIVVNGPVVVDGDVVIKGYVTGQGTIYTGRNVNIIGNVTYENPPNWPKPMFDKSAVKTANQGKDLVGFAAKGSIVLGNYTTSTWQSDTAQYQKPPFTAPYEVDPTDAANGYVSYTDSSGKPMFNGDYTAYDGGTKPSNDGTTTVQRRFYESSFSDAEINSLADTGYITHVDGVLYTNHLLSGRVGASTFNGSIVSRDEAIVYSSMLTVNYDTRIRDNGYEYIDIFLPRQPTYKMLYWSENVSQ